MRHLNDGMHAVNFRRCRRLRRRCWPYLNLINCYGFLTQVPKIIHDCMDARKYTVKRVKCVKCLCVRCVIRRMKK